MLLLGLLLLQNTPVVTAKAYRVAIDAEFAPFEFTDETGEVQGIAPDILRAIGKATGEQFIFVPMSWTQAVQALASGRIDIMQMIRTEARSKRYAFSTPFISLTQALFSRRGNGIRGMADIVGRRIAVQRHDIAEELLADRKDFQRLMVNNKYLGLELIQQNEVDGFFAAELPGQYLLQHGYLPDVLMVQGDLYPRPLCFVTRPERQALLRLINRQLAQMKTSGELAAIIQSWTRPAPAEAISWWWIVPLVGLLLFVAPGLLARGRWRE